METKEYFEKEMFFRKPTFNSLYDPFGSPCRGQKPSLPLRKAPPFSPSLSSIVFTPPSVPPVLGDRNPQGREDVTALQCCICPTCPSPAGGSLTHSQALALSKRARDVTALRCSEPLRFMGCRTIKGLRHVVRDGTAWGKVDRIIEVLVLW